MTLKHLLGGVAMIGLMAQPALAQTQDTTAPQPVQAEQADQQLAEDDLDFAKKVAEGGLLEVRLGELAQLQAANPEVRQFGHRMVQDHRTANDHLMQIAQQKGIELPQELSEDAQDKVSELQEKSGDEFDQAYMDEMVSDHEEDVDTFEDYLENGEDADLRSFAEQTLPVLREHLDLARQTVEVASDADEVELQDAAMPGEEHEEAIADEDQEAVRHQAAVQGDISIEELLGSSVVNTNGDEVAEIEDVVLRDQTYYAILSVGGFLGIGEKRVAIPLDQLRLGEDEAYLMSAETEEQLEAMPEYDEDEYVAYQRQG